MDDSLALGKDFWEERYKNHQTGWDMGVVSPPIKEYMDKFTNKDVRILIPGGGKSHEAAYLAELGFTSITVLDISSILIDELKEKFKDVPQIKLVNADFFKFEGQFDLIIEQTFFCTLFPKHRSSYVEKMKTLLAPNGRLVGVLFNVEFPAGPPFGGYKDEYLELFQDDFKINKMEACYNSHPARQGNELWIDLQHKN